MRFVDSRFKLDQRLNYVIILVDLTTKLQIHFPSWLAIIVILKSNPPTPFTSTLLYLITNHHI